MLSHTEVIVPVLDALLLHHLVVCEPPETVVPALPAWVGGSPVNRHTTGVHVPISIQLEEEEEGFVVIRIA